MRGWCSAGDRTIFTSTATTKTDIVGTSYQVHESILNSSSSKSSSPHIPLEGLCSPFSTCDAPEISSKPHPEGGPYIMHRSYHTSNERGFWWIGVGMASFLQKLSRFCSMNTTCPSVSQISESAASAVPLRRSSFNAAMMDPSLSSRRHLRECSCRRRHSSGLESARACVRA